MLELLISIIQMISWGYVITQLENKKINIKSIKNISLILIMILCGYFVAVSNIGISRTIIGYTVYTICYKYIYNISFNKSSVLNFISLSMHCIGEIIIVFCGKIIINDINILQQYFR